MARKSTHGLKKSRQNTPESIRKKIEREWLDLCRVTECARDMQTINISPESSDIILQFDCFKYIFLMQF